MERLENDAAGQFQTEEDGIPRSPRVKLSTSKERSDLRAVLEIEVEMCFALKQFYQLT